MKTVFTKEFTVQHIHLDCFGRVKPSAMLHFVQRTVSAHCTELGISWDDIAPLGLIWVVGRSRLQVTRMPRLNEQLTVKTWPMPATRSAYPRAAVVTTADGEELYRCTTLWALMNKTTRRLVLPADSGISVPGQVFGNELPVPSSFAVAPADDSTTRKVCFSELDTNGHMNNTRYLDWVNDLFPSSFHKTHPFRDITVCYLSEAREGQSIVLQYHHFDDGSLQVDGLRTDADITDKKSRVFSVRIGF